MDPLAVSAYGAEQALPLIGTGTGTTLTGKLVGKIPMKKIKEHKKLVQQFFFLQR